MNESNVGASCGQLQTSSPSDREILYFGHWTQTAHRSVPDRRQSSHPCAACELVFKGPVVRWLGAKGPDHGYADVYVDGLLEQTLDAYEPTPSAARTLFEKRGLADGRLHTLRIVVRRDRNPRSSGSFQSVDGFQSLAPVAFPDVLRSEAMAELKAIVSGSKAYLAPETWKPVAYAATAPEAGVVLQPGVLRESFDRNIVYLNRCFANPLGGWWVEGLPASSEGRMLGGAGHTLRWGERADMRAIVDTVVAAVGKRQSADGYCLPYDRSCMGATGASVPGFGDERRNYDRVNLTRGMIAAGRAGNREAYGILRKFYDWLNPSEYYPNLLTGPSDGSGSNCNNGHAGGLLMYFSPVGRKEDLVAVERYFVQDFFLEQMRNAEPLALDYYPLHVPHSYVLLAFEAWLDHYRATGAAKYLEAVQGAWQVVNQYYEHVGGTMAICEERAGVYPPQSYWLHKHTGETCAGVFWAYINHRLLQLFPGVETYAAEIEKAIYNVILAAQGEDGSIRYHNHLDGKKDAKQCCNTCCEVMGVPFIARLPEFIYSLDDDGLWVNLFAASTVNWKRPGREVTLTTETEFPYGGAVALRIEAATPGPMKLRIRIPRWVAGAVAIRVNGVEAATGQPGSFATLDRTWQTGDTVAFELPPAFRLTRYVGLDQHPEHDRYALEYGPILMALVGGNDLDMPAADLIASLLPVEGAPLHFAVRGRSDCRYRPYWQLGDEPMTCFSTLRQ